MSPIALKAFLWELTNYGLTIKDDMKQLKITPPEGYEIDPDKSNLEEGVVEFRKISKVLTYEDTLKEGFYYIDENGDIQGEDWGPNGDGNEAPNKEQLKALLALNKLKNVANYLNGDWKPNWTDGENKYVLRFRDNKLTVDSFFYNNYGIIIFKCHRTATQAIEILGEDTVKLALSFGSL
jgi:hypothetical protein